MRFNYEDLSNADLIVDAIYEGGNNGDFSDDPVSKLMCCENQGGFRKVGTTKNGFDLKYVVLTSTQKQQDWKDEFDETAQILTYHGDNKSNKDDIHNTKKKGNLILQQVYQLLYEGKKEKIPPFFLFLSEKGRNVIFKGVVVPGASNMSNQNNLVVVYQGEKQIPNYRATFSRLNIKHIDRRWLFDLIDGRGKESEYAPTAWKNWIYNIEQVCEDEQMAKDYTKHNISLEQFDKGLEQNIKYAKGISKDKRIQYMHEMYGNPQKEVLVTVFTRNPYVIVETLDRAQGICERCGKKAPFNRVSDGTPYLEVHHIVRLADGGLDRLENTIAVCPNCHRELHYGLE